MPRWLERLARVVTVGFWMLTAAFAWLVSVPFVHENFVQPRVLPGLMEFAEWHSWATVALLPMAWLSVRSALGIAASRRAAQVVLGVWTVVAVGLLLTPGLAAVQPGPTALAVAVAALAIPLLFAVTDLLAAAPIGPAPATDHTGGDLTVVMSTAAVVAAIYALQTLALGSASWQGLLTSAITHAVFAGVLFLLLTAARSAAALSRRPGLAEFWLGTILLSAAFTMVVLAVIVPTFSIADVRARGAGAAIGATLGLVLAARGREGSVFQGDGIAVALGGLVPRRLPAGTMVGDSVRWLVVVALLAWGVDAGSRVMDWNFVLSTLGAVTAWLLALAGLLTTARHDSSTAPRPLPTWVPFAACVVILAVYHAAVPTTSRAEPAEPVRMWSMVDPSFRALGKALRPAAPANAGFYELLQRHTNLAPTIAVTPTEVRHASLDAPRAAGTRPPHVFVFVIDSLRRDYLAPYNAKVSFTPGLAQFATESVVFERAFTRYGATGLSVPSIWVGGLVPHKQYPKPFAPMNALAALLRHEGYASWISWDNIVDEIVPKDGTGPPLDATTAVKDLRFCPTLQELSSRLAAVTPEDPPVFTWALPQDVHIAVLTREGGKSADDGDYAGFYAPYASRVRRVDACFGAFVADLKAKGLYDDSIIVFTADHGDSLGEGGRWGHAYTLFPEIVQVPLLIHLPTRLREAFDTRPTEPAFTADVTPSLYALLGHSPTPPAHIFGRTLFWTKGQPMPPRPDDGALVASSYGSVYAWIDGAGRELYVSDGVDFRDYRFGLDGSAAGVTLDVTDDARRAGQDAIRRSLDSLAAFYKYDAGE